MINASPLDPRRDFTDETLADFQRLVLKYTGIELAESKRSMIINRFTRRLIALNIDSFEDYIKIISKTGHPEHIEFIDAITTNLTFFFRESQHFDVLGNVVLPRLINEDRSDKPIRIWSAGCSSGQEPYSIAMTIMNTLNVSKIPVKILCTDIHSKLVDTARLGKYNKEQLRGLSRSQIHQWFKETDDNLWQVDSVLRKMLYCKRLNLFGPWPIHRGVDIIMCRNVLIYFNTEYQRRLLSGFASLQDPGSFLFLGHSETLDGFTRMYKRVDNTVYERL